MGRVPPGEGGCAVEDSGEKHEAQVAFPTSTIHLPDALELRGAQLADGRPRDSVRELQEGDA